MGKAKMTKPKLKKLVKQLVKNYPPKQEIEKKLNKILESGAINISETEEDFVVPKAILTAIYQSIAEDFMPFDKEGRKIVSNLKHFV